MKNLIVLSPVLFSPLVATAVFMGLSLGLTTPAVAQEAPPPTLVPQGFLKIETIYSNRDLDAETVGAIKGRMNADASMSEIIKKVNISSRDNVIYLNGEVDSSIEMAKVVDHAKSISPANRVVNQISIKEPAPPTPVAAPSTPTSAEEAPSVISQ